MSELRKSWGQMMRYGVTGVLGTVLYLVVLILLVELVRLPPTISSFLSFSTTVVVCFFINSFWTFNSNDASFLRFTKYTVVSISGLLLTTAITYVGVDVLHLWYIYTQIAVVLVVPITNYVLNSRWVFSRPASVETETIAQ